MSCPKTASESYGYGYGWFVGHEPSGRAFVMHPGAIPGGFGALNEYSSDHRVTIIVLSNSWSSWSNFMNSTARTALESTLFSATG